MGTGCPFPDAKRGRGVTLTTDAHLVPPPWRIAGLLCFLIVKKKLNFRFYIYNEDRNLYLKC